MTFMSVMNVNDDNCINGSGCCYNKALGDFRGPRWAL